MTKAKNRVYFLVGRIRETNDYIILDDDDGLTNKKSELKKLIEPRIKRGLTKIYKHKNYKEKGEYVLAEYDENEIHPDDLKIIKKHRSWKAYIIGTEKPIEYYDFIHQHFLEFLRYRKVKMLKAEELSELDDGTIFGRISKKVQIAEKIIVIPAHEKEIFVEWDCYEDTHLTWQDKEDIYNENSEYTN